MSLDGEFFVYVDWTVEDVPRPFYVGFGNLSRVRNKRRNKHHTNIKKKYGLDRRVISVQDETTAKQLEIQLIAEHKTYVYGHDYVFGANYTVGGDGSRGHRQPPCSEERKQLLRELLSHPKTDETRRKMSESMQLRRNNASWIEKMKAVSAKRNRNV